MPAPMIATSTRSSVADSTVGDGSSSQNGVSTQAMLRESAIHAVAFGDTTRDVQLGEARDHLLHTELRFANKLVHRRRQELEERMVDRRFYRGGLEPERLEHVGGAGERRRTEP